jgi:hypothetical protein
MSQPICPADTAPLHFCDFCRILDCAIGAIMKIEDDVNKLASLERQVRTLDTLIQHLNSMDDEELKKALPRILQGQASEASSPASAPSTDEVPVLVFDEGGSGLRRRFWTCLREVEPILKKILSPFRFSSRQQNPVSALPALPHDQS